MASGCCVLLTARSVFAISVDIMGAALAYFCRFSMLHFSPRVFVFPLFVTASLSAHAQTTPALPTISINDPRITEGNAGNKPLEFKVSLSSASTKTVRVEFKTVSRTASSPRDFVSRRGTLSFAPGVRSVPLTIQIVGDTRPEANEMFRISLSAPINAKLRDNVGEGLIKNDDGEVPAAPGSGKIVFTSSSFFDPETGNFSPGGLHIINSDGSNLTSLTRNSNDTTPVWSPDGNKVAFRSFFLGTDGFFRYGLGVIDADGKNRRGVTAEQFSFGSSRPVWTGDGTALIYQGYDFDTGRGGIFKAPIDGSEKSIITNNSFDSDPAASINGRIAFASSFFETDGPTSQFTSQIFSINEDGTDRKQLTFDEDGNNSAPQWSADGKKIVYVARSFDSSGIFVMDFDGRNQRRLVDVFTDSTSTSVLAPRFSANGKKIVFTVDSLGTTSTYIADVESGAINEIASEGTSPVLSPDAAKVAFVSMRDDNAEIYVMNANGTSAKRLTNNSVTDSAPDFTAGSVPAPRATPAPAPNSSATSAVGSSAKSS
jgi:TolB protein